MSVYVKKVYINIVYIYIIYNENVIKYITSNEYTHTYAIANMMTS